MRNGTAIGLALVLLLGAAVWVALSPEEPWPPAPTPAPTEPAAHLPTPVPVAERRVAQPPPIAPVARASEAATELPEDTHAALEAFFAIGAFDPEVDEGMTREEEDPLHQKALASKASQLKPLLVKLDRDAEAPELRRRARLERARVHVDMGDFLAGAPAPGHLTAEQAAHYADAIQGKADAQYDLASEVLDALEADDPGAADAVAAMREAIAAR